MLDEQALAIARDLAHLGARSALATPAATVVSGEDGWPAETDAWAALGRAMSECEARWPDDAGDAVALEQWLIVLAAAAELYPDAAAALSIVAEDERLSLLTPVTFARLMRAAGRATFRAALACAFEGGVPGRYGLIDVVETVSGRPTTHRGLRLAPKALAALVAGQTIASIGLALESEAAAPPVFSEPLVKGAVALLVERGTLWLRAASARAGRQLALDVAGTLRLPALFLKPGGDLPQPHELGHVKDGLLVLDLHARADGRELPLGWIERVAAAAGRLIVVADARTESGPFAGLNVPRIGAAEAARVWAQAPLSEAERAVLAASFPVTLLELRAALRDARNVARAARTNGHSEPEPDAAALRRAMLAEGARRMGRFVTRIETDTDLTRLVLPATLKERLRDIVAWPKASPRVYGEMGVAPDGRMGRGLITLFSGPPGTGKTYAAQCVAAALGLNLYRVDLSQVVSKWIGETEKALAQVFDEAEAGHGILLFDEADALFGKRSEVKDAHDRYANIEVGFLLQRVESFDGILILATNLRNHLDGAFMRRIHVTVDFPMPDASARRRLWEQSLASPRFRGPDLDVPLFAGQFRLSGGSIKSIAIAAAHLAAAEDDGRVWARHVARATLRELEKNGQSRGAAEFGPLSHFMPEETWTPN
ncbi:MAG TPA: ATP-binding protein [Bradyrhizobium sp.]|nr:ATP-binding protein [Bradyrhizobium sp.]